MELFRLFGSIMIDDKQAIESLRKTEDHAKKNKRAFEDFKDSMKKVVAVAGTVAVAIGGKAVKSAMDFETEMANVGTLLGGDFKSKVAVLGDDVKKLAGDFGVSTSTLTDGLYNVISALGESEESMKILEIATMGASAGNASVTDSVNLLSAVMKGYGDVSAEAGQKASDLAFKTVVLGQTTFPELAASMGAVIPLASTMKVSQEELFGAMATLTGVTGNTSEVTTQLRGTIQGLLQPSADMQKALEALGYENGMVAIESEGLQGILNSLKEEVGGNEIAFSNLFGSVEAKNAVLALTGSQAEDFTRKSEAMKNAVGATSDAFAVQQDTVGATYDKLKEKANVFMIELGEKLLPTLENVLDWFMDNMPEIEEKATKAFDALGKAIGWVKDNGDWLLPVLSGLIGAFIALKVITVVSGAIATLQGVIGGATTVMGAFNAVLAANPIGLVALAIGVLIGVGVALYKNWDTIKAKAQELWSKITETFDKIKTKITTSIETARDKVQGAIEKIKSFFNFSWSLPKLKLPKLSITGKFSLVPPQVPKFALNWNAKGAVFDQATIFASPYGFQGVGEAGPEAVAPVSKLQEYIREAVEDSEGKDTGKTEKLLESILRALKGMSVVLDTGVIAGAVQEEQNFRTQRNLGGVGLV